MMTKRISPARAAVMMAVAIASMGAVAAQNVLEDFHIKDTGKRHGSTPMRKSWFSYGRGSTTFEVKTEARECARRRRQIESGMLRKENGLTAHETAR